MVLAEGARFSDLVVRRRVGRGGMGEVYLVHHEGLDRAEALKVLRGDPDGDVVTRFRAEARIGGRLRHPCIVSVYDLVDVDGQLALRMEYVDGPDLRAVVRDRGALAPAKAVRVVGDVADALDAAHRAGVLHRDVKPANILLPLDENARDAVLGDFGIGLLEGSARLTTSGLLGTVAYTAPERLSAGEAGSAADLYSLACSAFEALTGRPPYVGDTDHVVARAHLEDAPPSPRAVLADLPAALDPVFATALAKDPARRPPSATAFARALGTALGVDGGDARSAAAGASAAEHAAGDTRVVGGPVAGVALGAAARAVPRQAGGPGAARSPGGDGPGGAGLAAASGTGNGAAPTYAGVGRSAVPPAPARREPQERTDTRTDAAPPGHAGRDRAPQEAEEDTPRRRPPEVLVVQVSPQVVEVVPGGHERVDVRVHNEDGVAHDVEVRAQPSAGCGVAGGVVARLRVPPYGHADTALPVQVPRTSASRPGRHPYHVSVTDRGADSPADRCAGYVAVGTFDEIGSELLPGEATTRGWGDPVAGRLVLHNHGNRPAVIDAAVTHGPGLRRVLEPVRVTVPAGQSVVYGVRLSPAQSFWLGTSVRHAVRVDAVSGTGQQTTASTALVQRARLPWWLLVGLLAVLVLVVAGIGGQV